MKVRIRERSWIARLAAVRLKAGKVALVLGHTIHLHNTRRDEFLADKDWVCHELEHVRQYKRHGYIGFLLLYIIEWFRNGYYNNRFEVEARAAEKNRELIRDTVFV